MITNLTQCRGKVAKLAFITLALASSLAQAATSLWEVNLDFSEFAGQAGGFENPTTNQSFIDTATMANPVGAVRSYTVVRPNGVAPDGRQLFTEGLAPSAEPLKIQTQVFTNPGNPFGRARGGINGQGLSSQVGVSAGTSRPGDWAVMAHEFTVPVSWGATADTLRLRLDNINGSGELYEWAFVTVNEQKLADPGFDMSRLGTYRTNYLDLTNSSYYNPDGTVKAGGVSTTNPLPYGQTISQYLTDAPASKTYGLVRPGWWAADIHNSIIRDGVEFADNPRGATGVVENLFDISGADLGLDGNTQVETITVWMGYMDVGTDTNGDGFTSTGDNSQIGQISALTLGTSINPVPEPSSVLLGLLSLGSFALRRRR